MRVLSSYVIILGIHPILSSNTVLSPQVMTASIYMIPENFCHYKHNFEAKCNYKSKSSVQGLHHSALSL
jgi:hypothetical protein